MPRSPSKPGRTTPSNRLSHGLMSRAVAEARALEIKALGRTLTKGMKVTPDVRTAAEDVADSILSLGAIRQARLALLSQPEPSTVSDAMNLIDMIARLDKGKLSEAELLALVDEEDSSDIRSHCQLLKLMTDRRRELHRIDEYERKAHSRYRKRITRFDYAVIEAQRKR